MFAHILEGVKYEHANNTLLDGDIFQATILWSMWQI